MVPGMTGMEIRVLGLMRRRRPGLGMVLGVPCALGTMLRADKRLPPSDEVPKGKLHDRPGKNAGTSWGRCRT